MLTSPVTPLPSQVPTADHGRDRFGNADHTRAGEADKPAGRNGAGLASVSELASRLNVSPTAFVDAAKEMVRTALDEFRKGLGDMLRNMGFDDATVSRVVKNLFQPVGEALRSGADFTAQIFVAAASQTSVVTQAGSASAFDLQARGIEITVNQTTGEIAVTTEEISVQARQVSGALAGTPQVIDFSDGAATPIPDIFAQFNEFIANQIDAFDALLPEERKVDDEAARRLAAPGADAAPVKIEVPDDGDTGSSVRLTVELFERFTNEQNEQITRIRLDAVIPLEIGAAAAPAPTVAPPPDGPVELIV